MSTSISPGKIDNISLTGGTTATSLKWSQHEPDSVEILHNFREQRFVYEKPEKWETTVVGCPWMHHSHPACCMLGCGDFIHETALYVDVSKWMYKRIRLLVCFHCLGPTCIINQECASVRLLLLGHNEGTHSECVCASISVYLQHTYAHSMTLW